jgi:GNAT superfamily N-acetyltransferase
VHHFYVHPSAHGAGIGRALMAGVVARHGEALSLKCVTRNVAARKFYRALGWTETDEPGGAELPAGNWIWIRTPAAVAKLGLRARQDTE